MECQYCNGYCQKAGKQKNGVQKHYCKRCKKYQQATYKDKAYGKSVNETICQLVCESVSVRGIARVLNIAIGTVLDRIRQAGKGISKPAIILNQPELQVDELRTFIGRKGNEYWFMVIPEKGTGS